MPHGRYVIPGLLLCLSCVVTPVRAQQASERDSMYYRYLEFAQLVMPTSGFPKASRIGFANVIWISTGKLGCTNTRIIGMS